MTSATAGEAAAIVCGIVRDRSRSSLRDLLRATDYARLRSGLSAADLVTYLADHPDVVGEWLAYSEDKRTVGGWYCLNQDGAWIVGRLGPRATRVDERRHTSSVEACAEFILLELDFWAALSPQ